MYSFVLDKLPVVSDLRLDLSNPCKNGNWPNMVIRGNSSNYYFPKHEGPLSIIYNISGSSYCQIQKRNIKVTDDAYLVLNNGSEYSITVDSREPVDQLYVFFNENFVAEVLNELLNSDDILLENPEIISKNPYFFINNLYEDSPEFQRIMRRAFKLSSFEGFREDEWLDEQFYYLLADLFKIQSQEYATILDLPYTRNSTKLELYKRIQPAKEYIDSNYTYNISLEQLSKLSRFSRFHFLRVFKEIFGITPRQYIVRKRLLYASKLLQIESLSITEICFQVGFESLGYFSSLFKSHFKKSPQHFRAALKV